MDETNVGTCEVAASIPCETSSLIAKGSMAKNELNVGRFRAKICTVFFVSMSLLTVGAILNFSKLQMVSAMTLLGKVVSPDKAASNLDTAVKDMADTLSSETAAKKKALRELADEKAKKDAAILEIARLKSLLEEETSNYDAAMLKVAQSNASLVEEMARTEALSVEKTLLELTLANETSLKEFLLKENENIKSELEKLKTDNAVALNEVKQDNEKILARHQKDLSEIVQLKTLLENETSIYNDDALAEEMLRSEALLMEKESMESALANETSINASLQKENEIIKAELQKQKAHNAVALDKAKRDSEEKLARQQEDSEVAVNKALNKGITSGLLNACQWVGGWYTYYYFCVMGDSFQLNSNSGGHTCYKRMGAWAGSTVNSKTGVHVWKWNHGQWGSSATAYVKCGNGWTITSAWESPTNQYKFNMESPLACIGDPVGTSLGL